MSTYSLDLFYIIWLNVLFIWILGVSIFFTLNSEMNCLVLPSYVGIRDGIWIWSENRFFSYFIISSYYPSTITMPIMSFSQGYCK